MRIQNPGALGLGALFAAGTGYVLFSDVRSLTAITVDHVMSLLVLVGTIASGHMFWQQARSLRLFPSLGLAVLFLAGTFYCVTASAARNADVTVAQRSAVHSVNIERERIRPLLERSERMLAEAQASLGRECASGKGKRCDGITATIIVYEGAVKGYKSELGQLGPERGEDAGIKHAAQVFAALPYVTVPADVIASRLLLFGPFVKALFLEVACIVFTGIGLGRGGTQRRVAVLGSVASSSVAPAVPRARQPSQQCNALSKATERQGKAVRQPRRQPSADDVLAALARAGKPLSNEELASELGVTEGAASRIRKRAGDQLRVEREGKQLRISLAVRH